MSLDSVTDVDVSTPKNLRDRFAIAGVGETTYTRGSGRTTRSMANWAIRNALADAGMKPSDVDGLLSYSNNDSTPSPMVARSSSKLRSPATGTRACTPTVGVEP